MTHCCNANISRSFSVIDRKGLSAAAASRSWIQMYPQRTVSTSDSGHSAINRSVVLGSRSQQCIPPGYTIRSTQYGHSPVFSTPAVPLAIPSRYYCGNSIAPPPNQKLTYALTGRFLQQQAEMKRQKSSASAVVSLKRLSNADKAEPRDAVANKDSQTSVTDSSQYQDWTQEWADGRARESAVYSADEAAADQGESAGGSIPDDGVQVLVDKMRRWELTPLGQRRRKHPEPGLEFSIMSYNALAQCLLEDNIYLYSRCNPRVLEWDYRKANLLKEFKNADADILCLQEIQQEHYETFYDPELQKLGYLGIYKKRTGDKNDGCAIFYKKDMFTLDDFVSVEYCRSGVRVLDRDNIALVAILRPKDATVGRKFCVANTHLLFNPGRGDIKLAQMRILLAEIDKYAFQRLSHASPERCIYHPIIICGDMNCEPHCYLYRFLGTGKLRYEGLVAGDISGQREGYYRGRFQLEKELVPPTLGISDQCQYIDMVNGRNGYRQPEVDKNNEGTSSGSDPSRFSTGCMTHNLNLLSVYRHNQGNGQAEVTTFHGGKCSCTVDYIFYSVQNKRSYVKNSQVVHSNVNEGSLALLGTYSLLASSQLECIGGIPNSVLPSDHLPLVAKFLLRNS